MTVSINGTSGLVFNDASTQNTAATGFGFKNRIINGAMVIDQRNAGAAVTPSSSTYTLDRMQAVMTQASKYSVQQNAGSVTPPTGFKNYLGVTSASAYSVGSSDVFAIRQHIEGFNVADLGWGTAGAATVTLSFWVRSSLTGTFGGSLMNSAQDRAYLYSYTVSAANTWEQKTVTIAGDTTGTWLTTNGTGVMVNFGLGVGSTFSGTSGAWAASNLWSSTGATSVVGTNGATFYVTGVQLEKGSTATSFDYRPYGTELQLAQRYYYRTSSTASRDVFGTGFNNSSTRGDPFVSFPVTMRTQPTALEQSGTAANYGLYHAATATVCSSVPVYSAASTQGARVNFTVASGLTTGQACMGYVAATGGYLGFSVEL
jgi:hypothetical protein